MKETEEKKSEGLQAGRRIASAGGAGLSMLTIIGLGMAGGLKADEYFGTYPICFVTFSVLGAVGGLGSVIRKMVGK